MYEEKPNEFIDAEDQSFFEKNQLFSHEALVMESIRRCNESGSHELRAGWFNEKVDNQGNRTRTYIEDTREKFISCVKILEVNISCDFDKKSNDRIKKLKKSLKSKRDALLNQQFDWYDSHKGTFRTNVVNRFGYFHSNEFKSGLPYLQLYLVYAVKIDRLLKNGKFSHSKTSDEIKILMQRQNNPLVAFANDILIREDGNKISKETMYKIYTKWSQDKKVPRLSKEQLGRNLAK